MNLHAHLLRGAVERRHFQDSKLSVARSICVWEFDWHHACSPEWLKVEASCLE